MKTAEFKTLINKIENVSKNGELTKLENRVWNEQTFYTNKQWEKVLIALVKVAHDKGLLSLSVHHTELKAAAQQIAAEANTKGDKQMSNKKENTTPADTQPAQTTEQPTEAPAPVEVLKGEVIDTKQEKAINAAIDRISKKVENIGKGYLDIVGDVARLRSLEAWKVTGHKSLYDLCADKFGMARGTVANLEAVFKKYGDPETFKLTDACAGMSLREMLAAISEEKKALKGEVAGEPADGEESGEAGDKGGKKKAETLISITWELAGDDWNVEAILEEIRKQLEANPDAKEAFPDGANVSFTITH